MRIVGRPSFAIFVSIAFFRASTASFAQEPNRPQAADDGLVRVEADGKGFHWAYYLHVPAALRQGDKSITRTLLVLPNNTGSSNDDITAHDKAAKKLLSNVRPAAERLGMVLLQPVFPRPKTDWRIYTHALDRDTLLTKKDRLERLDLQLVAMVDDAIQRLAGDGLRVDRKVALYGFSASGMFCNRFVFLHPDRVQAAAIGSPGGWPIAPMAQLKGKSLRYPIGIADLQAVSGHPFDANAVAKIPLLVFMGDKDTNDSVTFRDSYEEEDEKLIFELFGATPVERWMEAQRLYKEVLPMATFKLYPGVGHQISPEMQKDVAAFLGRRVAK